MENKKTYILFEKKIVAAKPQMMIFTQEDLMNTIREQMQMQMVEHQNQGEDNEEWKEGNTPTKTKNKPKMKMVYEFIAKVDNPAAVAKIVRQQPTKKYALFTGILSTIDIQLPVLIDGIAADAMSEEWAVNADDLRGFDPSMLDDIDEDMI